MQSSRKVIANREQTCVRKGVSMMDKKKILIVDDYPHLFLSLKEALSREGYCAEAAENWSDAQRKLKDLKPILVLLEMTFLGHEGVEILKQIKADPELEGIHILVLTAKQDERELKAIISAGADKCMTRPFGFGELMDFIQEISQ